MAILGWIRQLCTKVVKLRLTYGKVTRLVAKVGKAKRVLQFAVQLLPVAWDHLRQTNRPSQAFQLLVKVIQAWSPVRRNQSISLGSSNRTPSLDDLYKQLEGR